MEPARKSLELESSRDELVRKQYLVSTNNIKKIKDLLDNKAVKASSASEIIRLAIEAYDPQSASTIDSNELMELVSERLKLAIKSTQKANKKVAKTLKTIEKFSSI